MKIFTTLRCEFLWCFFFIKYCLCDNNEVTDGQKVCAARFERSACVPLPACGQYVTLLKNTEATDEGLRIVTARHCGFEGLSEKVCCPVEGDQVITNKQSEKLQLDPEDYVIAFPLPGECGVSPQSLLWPPPAPPPLMNPPNRGLTLEEPIFNGFRVGDEAPQTSSTEPPVPQSPTPQTSVPQTPTPPPLVTQPSSPQPLGSKPLVPQLPAPQALRLSLTAPQSPTLQPTTPQPSSPQPLVAQSLAPQPTQTVRPKSGGWGRGGVTLPPGYKNQGQGYGIHGGKRVWGSFSSNRRRQPVKLNRYSSWPDWPQPVAPRGSAPQPSAPESLAPQTSVQQLSAAQTLEPQPSASKSPAPEHQSLAPQSSAPRGSAPQPSAPQTLAPESLAPQPMVPQPSASKPSAPELLAPQPLVPQPSAAQPLAPKPSASESLAHQPLVPQPSAPESLAPQPLVPQPSASPSLALQPSTPFPSMGSNEDAIYFGFEVNRALYSPQRPFRPARLQLKNDTQGFIPRPMAPGFYKPPQIEYPIFRGKVTGAYGDRKTTPLPPSNSRPIFNGYAVDPYGDKNTTSLPSGKRPVVFDGIPVDPYVPETTTFMPGQTHPNIPSRYPVYDEKSTISMQNSTPAPINNRFPVYGGSEVRDWGLVFYKNNQSIYGTEGPVWGIKEPFRERKNNSMLTAPVISSGKPVEPFRGQMYLPPLKSRLPESSKEGGTGAESNDQTWSSRDLALWMALLGYKYGGRVSWQCGGTIITERHVLTAAHCVKESLYVVRLGELDFAKEEKDFSPIDILVKRAIPHEDYVKFHNDIAILVLQDTIDFSSHVHIAPVCLPSSPRDALVGELLRSTRGVITGWGDTSKTGQRSSHLLYAFVNIQSRDQCAASYADTNVTVDARVLCAGDGVNRHDACNGDSGGPLVVSPSVPGTAYHQLGIVSYGFPCRRERFLGVYTNVTNYMPWIEEKVLGRPRRWGEEPSG